MKTLSKTTITSNSYTEVKPFYPYEASYPSWQQGMVTGNGHIGVICSGSPYSETLIYQNINLIMPSNDPRRTPPEVSKKLHEARQAVVQFDDAWDVNGRKRTYNYAFHPAHQLRLEFPKWSVTDYERKTDYETGEVSVRYINEKGTWLRRTFASREDNIIITE